MRWLGYKQVSFKSIRVDMPDIKRRMKTDHVKDLAENIKMHGSEPIQAPTVRAKTSDLLCGRDRYSASLLNEAKKLWVHVVECDDREAKELELSENIYRRADNRAELIAQLVKLKEQHYKAEQEQAIARGEKVSAAPSNSPIAKARKEVAKAANVSTATVVSHEKHVARKSAKDAEIGNGEPGEVTRVQGDETEQEGAIVYELPEGFNTFGLIVSQDEIREIENITLVLGDWDKANRRTLGHLTDIEKAGGAALAPTHAQKIRERLQAAGHAIRDAIPASLCYFCKSLDALKAACPACGGTGVVGMHGGDNVPPELKLGEPKARVAVNGKFMMVGAADNAAVGAEAKPAKQKSIKVTQVDGSVADLDNIDDDAQAF